MQRYLSNFSKMCDGALEDIKYDPRGIFLETFWILTGAIFNYLNVKLFECWIIWMLNYLNVQLLECQIIWMCNYFNVQLFEIECSITWMLNYLNVQLFDYLNVLLSDIIKTLR